MTDDLKPCPECGSSNLGHFVSALPINSVYCRDCGHDGPLTSDTFGDAEEAWNEAALRLSE